MKDIEVDGIQGLGQILSELRHSNNDDVSIILVGSAARNTRTEDSDVDLLALGETRPKPRKTVGCFHIQTASVSEFLCNIEKGEDFEAWCIRFGIALYDHGAWRRVLNSAGVDRWPRWQLKVEHAARRLFLAHSFLEMGDEAACSEELIYTLGHIIRAFLLRAEIFPLSRPELAEQVSKIGYPHLADIHERLRGGQFEFHLLNQACMYSKRLLCFLDRDRYGAFAADQRLKQKTKGVLSV
jgi:predicted nucleotidyltransferase